MKETTGKCKVCLSNTYTYTYIYVYKPITFIIWYSIYHVCIHYQLLTITSLRCVNFHYSAKRIHYATPVYVEKWYDGISIMNFVFFLLKILHEKKIHSVFCWKGEKITYKCRMMEFGGYYNFSIILSELFSIFTNTLNIKFQSYCATKFHKFRYSWY